ncbi:MAG: radical SAM protein [Promethearchaeota archaeon]|nr:MAG: radical SAM protein [Candidatus Lokiarchaeota archaeon]
MSQDYIESSDDFWNNHPELRERKKIQKIIFVEPKTEKLHIYSKFELPRIGTVLLATIMKKLGYECRAYYMKTDDFLAKKFSADLICISTITTTAPAAFKIAEYYKSQHIPVVIGGPHVTALPEEALEYADYVIRGEGEIPLPELVEALNGDRELESVQGLAWKEKGTIKMNELPYPIEDLDALPFPDYNLLDTGGTKMSGLSLKPTIPFQTSRGCPFDCKFCSVTAMFGKKFRYRSVESVIEEMKLYNPKEHIFFFYDDNFSANNTRTKNLLRAMINNKENFGGHLNGVHKFVLILQKMLNYSICCEKRDAIPYISELNQ